MVACVILLKYSIRKVQAKGKRMTGFRNVAALLCLPLIAGCSQLAGVPVAEPFPDASLRKAKSAEHWNVITGDVAMQTAGLKARPEIQGKPLYVSASGDHSDFSVVSTPC